MKYSINISKKKRKNYIYNGNGELTYKSFKWCIRCHHSRKQSGSVIDTIPSHPSSNPWFNNSEVGVSILGAIFSSNYKKYHFLDHAVFPLSSINEPGKASTNNIEFLSFALFWSKILV